MKTEYLTALIALRSRELQERPQDVELGIALHRILQAAVRCLPEGVVEERRSRPNERWGYFCEFPGLERLASCLTADLGRYHAALLLMEFRRHAEDRRGPSRSNHRKSVPRRDDRQLAERLLREPARIRTLYVFRSSGLPLPLPPGEAHRQFRSEERTWASRARAATDARTAHGEAAEMLQELRGFFAPGRERRAGVPKLLQRIARLFTGRWGWARSLRMIRRAVAMHRLEVEAGRSDDVELLSELLLDEARLQSLLRAWGPAETALNERDDFDRRALARGDASAEARMCATEVERALLELRRSDPVAAVKRLRATIERSHPMCRDQPRSCRLVREHVELSLLLAAACRRAGDAAGWASAYEEAVTVGTRFDYPGAADRLHAEILRGHRGRFHVTAAAVLAAEASSLPQS